MIKPKISLVSIGHIDHGKSTLVGRLLYDSKQTKELDEPEEFSRFLDALEEEREKGITIDIVHTPFEGSNYRFEIIDCPGHKEFIKNMMSGASHAACAQLLVSAAAGEGIQEQTLRHLYLAKLFGIKQIAVIINKMDLANYSKEVFLALKQQITQILNNLGYQGEQNITFIPTSGKLGENVFFRSSKMPWWEEGSYLEALENFVKVPKTLCEYCTRFSVQSVINNNGSLLVVGRVESGKLAVRQALRSEPSKQSFRVQKIKDGENEKEEAIAGESVGLLLKEDTTNLKRGAMLLNRVDEPSSATQLEAEIYITAEKGIKEGESLKVRANLQEVNASIRILSAVDPLNPLAINNQATNFIPQNYAARVQVIASEPLFVEPFSKNPTTGRIILEKDGFLTAAGIVVEN